MGGVTTPYEGLHSIWGVYPHMGWGFPPYGRVYLPYGGVYTPPYGGLGGHESGRKSIFWHFEKGNRHEIARSICLDYSRGSKTQFLNYFFGVCGFSRVLGRKYRIFPYNRAVWRLQLGSYILFCCIRFCSVTNVWQPSTVTHYYSRVTISIATIQALSSL